MQQNKLPLIYFFALFFGLIHGLAYASSFLDLEGKEGLVAHLFAFNIGIELAQLLVVTAVLFISFVIVQLLKISRLAWIRVASLLVLAVSINMAYKRFPHNKNYHNEKTAFIFTGSCRHWWSGQWAEHTKTTPTQTTVTSLNNWARFCQRPTNTAPPAARPAQNTGSSAATTILKRSSMSQATN